MSDQDVSSVHAFLAALARRDFTSLERSLADDVRFRALVPSALREHSTAAETAERFRLWFAEVDDWRPLESHAEALPDCVRLGYRFACRTAEEGACTVEQQGYARVEGGLIADLSLVCSGFRPAE